MISQRCPKCNSSRVRSGYRSTPLWSKVLFRYNLLCNNCNWEFVGFAVPGTVSSKPNRRKKKRMQPDESADISNETKLEDQTNSIAEARLFRVKKRIKVRQ